MSGIDPYTAGRLGLIDLGTTPEDRAAYLAGAAARSSGGGPGGGAAMVALPFLLLAMIPAIVIGTCVYPLAGVLTLVGTSLIAGLLPDNVAFMMMLVVVLLPGIVMFVMALRLESVLERNRWYRIMRTAARMMVVGFVADIIVINTRGAGNLPRKGGYLDEISLDHALIVIAAMAGAYFLSRALDGKFGVAGFKRRFGLRGV